MYESLRGQFLISGAQLRDPNFFKTAVLIVEHSDEGAMGLVVNRPSSVTVSNALAGHFSIPDRGDLVYVGGPVEPANLFIMHDCAELNDDEDGAIAPGLYVGSSPTIFHDIVESLCDESCDVKFRIYSGCAGWSPGQLEGEIARGDWHTHPADASYLFYEDPYNVWDLLLSEYRKSKRLLPFTTPHPEWN